MLNVDRSLQGSPRWLCLPTNSRRSSHSASLPPSTTHSSHGRRRWPPAHARWRQSPPRGFLGSCPESHSGNRLLATIFPLDLSNQWLSCLLAIGKRSNNCQFFPFCADGMRCGRFCCLGVHAKTRKSDSMRTCFSRWESDVAEKRGGGRSVMSHRKRRKIMKSYTYRLSRFLCRLDCKISVAYCSSVIQVSKRFWTRK